MYLGASLMFVGGSLVTGAASALAVGLALSVLLAVRSLDEEALLSRELPGYAAYRRRGRYRLHPVRVVTAGPRCSASDTSIVRPAASRRSNTRRWKL